VHLGHDVDAVGEDPLALWRAQGGVQNRALLGRVDFLAAEHRFDAPSQAALLGEAQQQPERLRVDAVLRVVEVKSGGFRREALAAPGILGEELAQVQIA